METFINEIRDLPLSFTVVFAVLFIMLVAFIIRVGVLSTQLKREKQRNSILRSTLQRRIEKARKQ